MLISEVIRLLEERRAETGDVEVQVYAYSDCASHPVGSASAEQDRDGKAYVLLDIA